MSVLSPPLRVVKPPNAKASQHPGCKLELPEDHGLAQDIHLTLLLSIQGCPLQFFTIPLDQKRLKCTVPEFPM